MSPEIVRAVKRYQRLLLTCARKRDRIAVGVWSDEVLRAERVVITRRALEKALEHLKGVLLADALCVANPRSEKP